MKNIYLFILASLFCLSSATVVSNTCNGNPPPTNAEKIKGEFSVAPFAFTENKGQVFGYDGLPHPEVKYAFQQGNTQLFLLEKGIAYQFTKVHYPEGFEEFKKTLTNKSRKQKSAVDIQKLQALQSQIRTETFRMNMTLVGANPDAEITTKGKSVDVENFYNRNTFNVHNYSEVRYHNIYQGIDWVIYTKNGEVKYDFVLKPGADPGLIKMEFEHQEELKINDDGSFTLKNSLGSITEQKPISFQGDKQINTLFILNEHAISFALANYDHDQDLTIDPSLLWATYYGGAGLESANSVCTDGSGNVYLAGCTAGSSVNIASGGHQNSFGGNVDAYLVKFNSAGLRQWATYYGDTELDIGGGCATDAAGNVYLCGGTQSTVNIASGGHQNSHGGGFSDAFLVKFNSSGVRQWATYYGGAGTEFEETLALFTGWAFLKCTTDALNNVYLCGKTNSSAGIASGGHQNTLGGDQDAFLVKFNSSGVRQWATYYGGTNLETGNECVVDGLGNIYLVGNTESNNNIASGGHKNTIGADSLDAYLVKFNSSGVRQWATYYGDSGDEEGHSCSVDGSGNVFISGLTSSTANIATGGHQNVLGGSDDGFLIKFNGSGVRQWGTYYGGPSFELAIKCVVNLAGNVFICGYTTSTVSIASGGYQNTYNDSLDAYVVKFDNNGVRQWGSYYGGPNFDLGMTLATDGSGNIYLAGTTQSSVGIASGGHQNTIGGGYDPNVFWEEAFLAKFCDGSSLQPITGGTAVCAGSVRTYSVVNDPAVSSYFWALPGSWSGSSTTNILTTTVGVSGGTISVTTSSVCGIQSSVSLAVSVSSVAPLAIGSILGNTSVCSGSSRTFSVVNDPNVTNYVWTLPALWLGSSTTNSISVTPTSSGILTVSANNSCGSSSLQSAFIVISPIPTITVNSGSICNGQSFVMSPGGASTYTFSGGSATVNPLVNSSYSVTGTNTTGCVSSSAAVSNVSVNAPPIISVNSGSICNGQSFTITASGASSYTYSGGTTIVTPVSNSTYSVTGTSSAGCVSTLAAVLAVTVNAIPIISVNSGSICNGQSFTISPSGASTYTVSGGSTIVSPVSNTNYSVIGTSSTGCVSTLAAVSTVTVYARPVISINSGTICNGQSFTLVPGGAITYTISGGSTIVSPVSNTNYSVNGTSTAGCVSASAAVSSLTVNAIPVISVNSGSICNGQSFTITPSGANTYTVSGGSTIVSPSSNSTYSVNGTSTAGCVSTLAAVSSLTVNARPIISVNSGSICNGQSFTISPSGASTYTVSGGSTIVSPASNTSYSVTGTSSLGCISNSAAISNLTVNTLPVISVNSGTICNGQSFTISPSGASTYTVSGGSTIVSPVANTNYSVSGTSSAGCVSALAAVATVTVNAIPVITVNNGSICNGQSFTISPSGASTYTVSGGLNVVSPSINTSYSVSGTSLSGCVSSITAISNVTVYALPVISVNSGSICNGQSFTISPSGASTYTVSGGSNIVSPSSNTSYSVSGTSSLGCVSNSSAISNVTVNTLPVISVNSGSICSGKSFTIVPGGANTYTISGGSNIVSPSATSQYSVSGTNSAGCISSVAAVSNVSVVALPTINISGTLTAICAGESVSLSALGASTYTWSDGSNGAGIAIHPITTSTYSILGTNSSGCENTATVTQNVDACVGIVESTASALQLAVYPNPNKGEFTIETAQEIEVIVFNSLGQIVLQQNLAEGKNKIDLNNQAKGIYFIQIQQGEILNTVKIIKE